MSYRPKTISFTTQVCRAVTGAITEKTPQPATGLDPDFVVMMFMHGTRTKTGMTLSTGIFTQTDQTTATLVSTLLVSAHATARATGDHRLAYALKRRLNAVRKYAGMGELSIVDEIASLDVEGDSERAQLVVGSVF